MLNEERVKHMTKLAFYEAKGGDEDLKVSFYYKKDYIRFQTFWSVFWMTIAFAALIGLFALLLMDNILAILSSKQLVIIICSLLGIYMILLVAYTRYARQIYKRKHARAYHRVKRFKDDLEQLEKLYEKEEEHEQVI